MKITFHGELNISRFTENNFAKLHFSATKEITIYEEKNNHFSFHGPIMSHENTLYHPLR